MAKLLILFICGLIPAALSQCTVQRAQPKLKRSAYEFAVQLTARIAQDNENHFVASTFSIWALLSTASLGADGATLDELRKVLKLHRQQCFNDRFFELLKPVSADGNVTIERSSTMVVAEELRILPKFRRRVESTGMTELLVVPFDNPERVAATINEYVSRATHDTITDLVEASDLDGVYLIMLDALYFKALWLRPFPYESTSVKPFYDDLGFQSGEVNMMRVVGAFSVATVGLLNATVLELPFGSDGRYVMLIFLPKKGTTLSAVIDSLMKVSLSTIYTIFARDDMRYVSVEIPKFDITSDLDNLKELLSDMGLRTVFDSYSAQFPHLSDASLYVSNIVQKATVKVSEEGAEASAATGGFLSSRSGPESFRADKPFFYMIVNSIIQVPLFTGAYSTPTLQ